MKELEKEQTMLEDVLSSRKNDTEEPMDQNSSNSILIDDNDDDIAFDQSILDLEAKEMLVNVKVEKVEQES